MKPLETWHYVQPLFPVITQHYYSVSLEKRSPSEAASFVVMITVAREQKSKCQVGLSLRLLSSLSELSLEELPLHCTTTPGLTFG